MDLLEQHNIRLCKPPGLAVLGSRSSTQQASLAMMSPCNSIFSALRQPMTGLISVLASNSSPRLSQVGLSPGSPGTQWRVSLTVPGWPPSTVCWVWAGWGLLGTEVLDIQWSVAVCSVSLTCHDVRLFFHLKYLLFGHLL